MPSPYALNIDGLNPGNPNVASFVAVQGSGFLPAETIQLSGIYHGCSDQTIIFDNVVADSNGTFGTVSQTFFPSWPNRSTDPVTVSNGITITATTDTDSVTQSRDARLFDGPVPTIIAPSISTVCGDTLINFTAQAQAGLAEMQVLLPPWMPAIPPGLVNLCPNATAPVTFGSMINFPATGTFQLTAKATSNSGRTASSDFQVQVTGDPVWAIAFDQPQATCPLTTVGYTLNGTCFSLGQHTIDFSWTDSRGPQTNSAIAVSENGQISLEGNLQVAWASPLTIGVQIDLSPIQTSVVVLGDTVAPSASLSRSGANLCITAQDLGSGVARVVLTGPNVNFDHTFPPPTCDGLVCFPSTVNQPTTYTLTAFDQRGNSSSQQVTLGGNKFFNRTVWAACGQPGQRVGFRQRIDYDPPSNSVFPLGRTLVTAKKRGKTVGQFYVTVRRSARC